MMTRCTERCGWQQEKLSRQSKDPQEMAGVSAPLGAMGARPVVHPGYPRLPLPIAGGGKSEREAPHYGTQHQELSDGPVEVRMDYMFEANLKGDASSTRQIDFDGMCKTLSTRNPPFKVGKTVLDASSTVPLTIRQTDCD
eukprot:2229083-Amphidinium_carterae.1